MGSAVYARTDGIPLFLTEFGRLAAAEGTFQNLRLPPAVADVISLRFRGLRAESLDALECAAILGEQFSLKLVETVGGQRKTQEQLLSALSAGLLHADSAGGLYRFSHALVREALLERIDPRRRARLNLRAAHALEAQGRGTAADVAVHLREAGELCEVRRLVSAFHRAGEEALAAYSRKEAEAWLRLALSAMPQSSQDLLRAEVNFALSRCYLVAGHKVAGRYAPVAFERYLQAGRPDLAIAVAACPYEPGWGDSVRWLLDMTTRTLELASQDSPQWGWLIVQQAWARYLTHGDEQPTEMEAAFRWATQRDDYALRALAVRRGDVWEPPAQAISDLRRSSGPAYWELVLLGTEISRALLVGDDEVATRVEPRMAEILDRGLRLAVPRVVESMIAVYLDRGDRDRTSHYIDLIAESRILGVDLSRARLSVEEGDIAAARKWSAHHAARSPASAGRRHVTASGWFTVCAQHAYLAHKTGVEADLGWAKRTVDILQARSRWALWDRRAAIARAMLAVATNDRASAVESYRTLSTCSAQDTIFRESMPALALTAAAAGESEAAERHFLDAIKAFDTAGRLVPAAWTRLDLALMLDPDSEQLRALLDRARQTAMQIGLSLLLRRIRSVEGATWGSQAPTPRESEILSRLAAGAANKQIAAALGIAEKTVETHLRNLYRRLGLSGRAEAAAWATRQGWV